MLLEKLKEFDSWIIARVENFCQWWQKNISGEQNCFWWAKQKLFFFTCYNILSVTTIVWCENPPGRELLKFVDHIFFGETVSIFLIPVLCYKLIKEGEEATKRMQLKGLANIYKLTLLFPRLSCLLLISILISVKLPILIQITTRTPLLLLLGNILYPLSVVVVAYFSSCNPLPPSKSKVSQWLKNFIEGVRGIFIPSPPPVPIPVPSK